VKIVSFLNSKGGVGKTTLAANLGTAAALSGKKVLLIDLDAQASLTYSFYSPDGWQPEMADSPTIRRWLEHSAAGTLSVDLAQLVLQPATVRVDVAKKRGELGLIPADGGLIDLELALAAEAGCKNCASERAAIYVDVHGRLRSCVRSAPISRYDLVILDCSPAFGMLTRAAVIASDFILVPTRPDYLSTYGISSLVHRVQELKREYNRQVDASAGAVKPAVKAQAEFLGVAFTMAQSRNMKLISVSDEPVRRVGSLGLRSFDTRISENKTTFGEASAQRRPAVLGSTARRGTARELHDLSKEFIASLWGKRV